MDITCPNHFEIRMEFSPTLHFVIVGFLTILTFLIVTTNSITLLLVIRTKQILIPFGRFLVLLCISDIMNGVLGTGLQILLVTIYRSTKNCYLELTLDFFLIFFIQISGFSALGLALDRYIRLRYPLECKRLLTIRRINYMLSVIIIISFLMASLHVTSSLNGFYKGFHMAVAVFDTLVLGFICCFYVKGYLYYRNSVLDLNNSTQSNGNVTVQSQRTQIIFIAKTVLYILISYILCYLPSILGGMISFIQEEITDQEPDTFTKLMLYVLHLLLYISSCVNALILMFRNRGMRSYILSVISN